MIANKLKLADTDISALLEETMNIAKIVYRPCAILALLRKLIE